MLKTFYKANIRYLP